MPSTEGLRGLLRKDDREWVQQQAHRYKIHVSKNYHLGPRAASERRRDHLLRRRVQLGLEDLVWLLTTWPPDQQNNVFTEERIRKLTAALLTSNYAKETESDTQRRLKRQYKLAAMFMEKGVNKCLEKIDFPYRDHMLREALDLMLILKRTAVETREGVSLSVKD